MENPFTDEFSIQEIENFDAPEYVSDDGSIEVQYTALTGRLDDYLNSCVRNGEMESPFFSINDRIWMSLTPMEIQSNFLPIQRAEGKVATAGLGLGYFALEAAAKDEVDSVDVYEMNEDVIEYFTEVFQDREGFEKIRIIQGDVRETLPAETAENGPYDYIYSDIYNHLCSTVVFRDMQLFMVENYCAKEYSFWGQERFILDAQQYGFAPPVREDEEEFLQLWKETEKPDQDELLSDDYRPLMDEDFVAEGITTLEEVHLKQRSRQLREDAEVHIPSPTRSR